MSDYETEAKCFIKQLTEDTQKRAVVAIKDAMEYGRDWEWIDTALRKKGVSCWEKWGFGLFFHEPFNGSVWEQIKRNREAENVDLDEFYEDS